MDGLDAIGETAGAVAVEMAVAAILERGGKVSPCSNCSSPMIGPYCANCGQPVETHRRSVVQLLHDFVKDIASFDSRILRTARALLVEPGELSLAFREGRTQRYVPAVRLYLFVSLIFFLVLSAGSVAILQLELKTASTRYVADKAHHVYFVKANGDRDLMDGFVADDKGNVFLAEKDAARTPIPTMKADGSLTQNISVDPHFFARLGAFTGKLHPDMKMLNRLDVEMNDPKSAKTGIALWLREHIDHMFHTLATDPAAVNGPLTEWIPRVLFILLPLFALLLAAFYWRQRARFYFVDHLVFSLNFHSFGFIALLLAAGLAQFLPPASVLLIAVVALGAYLLLSMKRFYRQGWGWTIAKFTTLSFIYYSFFVMPALAVIISVSLLHL